VRNASIPPEDALKLMRDGIANNLAKDTAAA
jgi:hypothetical protein